MYHINIFKNKVLYKKLKSFKSYDRAKKYYENKLTESNSIFFDVQIKNTKKVNYEIMLIEENSNVNQTSLFKIDEFGRNVKIKTDSENFLILEIKNYKIPEKVFDLKKNKKITFSELVNSYLRTKDLKVVHSINNKIIVQKDLVYNLFSCKDEIESLRFLSELSKYCIQNDRKDVMVVNDTSVPQKKFIYNELENMGYSRNMLYRKKTTHSERR